MLVAAVTVRQDTGTFSSILVTLCTNQPGHAGQSPENGGVKYFYKENMLSVDHKTESRENFVLPKNFSSPQ